MREFSSVTARLLAAFAAIGALGAASPSWAENCEGDRCGCPASHTTTLSPPGPLTVTFFGVTTLMFSDGSDRILIDGFFTRPSARQTLFAAIGPDAPKISAALGDGPPVRAILTAHAHHDHALDTAAVAEAELESIVVGTPSVAKLVMARRVPNLRVCVPNDEEMLTFGSFRVTAFEVEHGPSNFLLHALLNHRLTRRLEGDAWFSAYKDNRNLSFLIEHGGRRILVHPSAGHRVSGALPDAETVFLGLGRIGKMKEGTASQYLQATLRPGARLVVPVHWDHFTTPLGEPLRPATRLLDNVGVAFDRLCAEMKTLSEASAVLMDMEAAVTFDDTGGWQFDDATQVLCDADGTARPAAKAGFRSSPVE